MIPAVIEAHLRDRYGDCERHGHPVAATAQDFAAAEHVSGFRVAKPSCSGSTATSRSRSSRRRIA